MTVSFHFDQTLSPCGLCISSSYASVYENRLVAVTNSWLWSFYLFILITKCQKTKHTIHTDIYKLSYKTRGKLFGSKPLKSSIFQSC